MFSLCKKLFIASTIMLSASLFAKGEIIFVNMNKVFKDYYLTSQKDAAFKSQKEIFKKAAEKRAKDIDTLNKEAKEHYDNSLNAVLSAEKRQEEAEQARTKANQVETQRKELRDFLKRMDKKLQKQYLDMRQEVVKKITDHIQEYAKQHNYELVIDISGLTSNQIPVIVYYDKDKDITEVIIAELNRGHEDELAEKKETN